jgi:hypothetical protein
MNDIDLCHFGDCCAPNIIINDILKIKKKKLFMLGHYNFNDILNYLKENDFENIYKYENLSINTYNHVYHKFYNFIFNHDYIVKNFKIINYNFIKNRFDNKIKNFRETLLTNNSTVFITFTSNFKNLKINDMLIWLNNNINKFQLIIFTNDNIENYLIDYNLSIIKLDNLYYGWWMLDEPTKYNLYKEIYDKFLICLDNKNILHNFPKKLEETNYKKKMKINL